MAEAFGEYYPERGARMRAAVVGGDEPGARADVLRAYLDDLGPWPADEYARVHGARAPRPGDQRRAEGLILGSWGSERAPGGPLEAPGRRR